MFNPIGEVIELLNALNNLYLNKKYRIEVGYRTEFIFNSESRTMMQLMDLEFKEYRLQKAGDMYIKDYRTLKVVKCKNYIAVVKKLSEVIRNVNSRR